MTETEPLRAQVMRALAKADGITFCDRDVYLGAAADAVIPLIADWLDEQQRGISGSALSTAADTLRSEGAPDA